MVAPHGYAQLLRFAHQSHRSRGAFKGGPNVGSAWPPPLRDLRGCKSSEAPKREAEWLAEPQRA
jgi:hypothetical protein